MISRRRVLAGAAALSILPVPRQRAAATRKLHDYALTAAPAQKLLVGAPHPETRVWAYNDALPGPVLRARKGERLRVTFANRLPEPTTVHWHGVRLPNAMDGVPFLTQPPVGAGDGFVYEFDLPDAGTYWYHPHLRSFEQVARGLSGPLIVDEAEPPAVDRDVLWFLDDWRLTPQAEISGDFGHPHDLSHAGRLGNTVTLNGSVPTSFAVRAGERLRLRLVNAANARIFALGFDDHAPQVIALDGQPVEPHSPAGGRLVLAPAQRADLILDMSGSPGRRYRVTDTFYPRQAYELVQLEYDLAPPLRSSPPDAPVRLPSNPVAEPELGGARRVEVVFGGGMMGGMSHAVLDGSPTDFRELVRRGRMWAINGVVAPEHGDGHVMEPMLTFRRGETCLLAMENRTAFHHPMHLHGHTFRVLARDGVPSSWREWRDTVLLTPRERVEIGFVADNPGDWMFHCHILEHQQAGMMATIRVG
jgi:FtsP/CotA-like multicopper oxidase with cupredoxin domain